VILLAYICNIAFGMQPEHPDPLSQSKLVRALRPGIFLPFAALGVNAPRVQVVGLIYTNGINLEEMRFLGRCKAL
jgi:hypothetical protein